MTFSRVALGIFLSSSGAAEALQHAHAVHAQGAPAAKGKAEAEGPPVPKAAPRAPPQPVDVEPQAPRPPPVIRSRKGSKLASPKDPPADEKLPARNADDSCGCCNADQSKADRVLIARSKKHVNFDAFAFGAGGYSAFVGASQAVWSLGKVIADDMQPDKDKAQEVQSEKGKDDIDKRPFNEMEKLFRNRAIGSSSAGSWFVSAMIYDPDFFEDVLRAGKPAEHGPDEQFQRFRKHLLNWLQETARRREDLIGISLENNARAYRKRVRTQLLDKVEAELMRESPFYSEAHDVIQDAVLSKSPAELKGLPRAMGPDFEWRNLFWQFVTESNFGPNYSGGYYNGTTLRLGTMRWSSQAALETRGVLGGFGPREDTEGRGNEQHSFLEQRRRTLGAKNDNPPAAASPPAGTANRQPEPSAYLPAALSEKVLKELHEIAKKDTDQIDGDPGLKDSTLLLPRYSFDAAKGTGSAIPMYVDVRGYGSERLWNQTAAAVVRIPIMQADRTTGADSGADAISVHAGNGAASLSQRPTYENIKLAVSNAYVKRKFPKLLSYPSSYLPGAVFLNLRTRHPKNADEFAAAYFASDPRQVPHYSGDPRADGSTSCGESEKIDVAEVAKAESGVEDGTTRENSCAGCVGSTPKDKVLEFIKKPGGRKGLDFHAWKKEEQAGWAKEVEEAEAREQEKDRKRKEAAARSCGGEVVFEDDVGRDLLRPRFSVADGQVVDSTGLAAAVRALQITDRRGIYERRNDRPRRIFLWQNTWEGLDELVGLGPPAQSVVRDTFGAQEAKIFASVREADVIRPAELRAGNEAATEKLRKAVEQIEPDRAKQEDFVKEVRARMKVLFVRTILDKARDIKPDFYYELYAFSGDRYRIQQHQAQATAAEGPTNKTKCVLLAKRDRQTEDDYSRCRALASNDRECLQLYEGCIDEGTEDTRKIVEFSKIGFPTTCGSSVGPLCEHAMPADQERKECHVGWGERTQDDEKALPRCSVNYCCINQLPAKAKMADGDGAGDDGGQGPSCGGGRSGEDDKDSAQDEPAEGDEPDDVDA
eukprot:g69.t1